MNLEVCLNVMDVVLWQIASVACEIVPIMAKTAIGHNGIF